MRFEDLSAADQKLLNTDLGDFEKDAAEQVAIADEMYSVGFNKLATETADELDALMASEKNAAEEVSLDAESEKTASDLSAFIERGFFDGLCKLGQERHGDPYVYIYPYIEEKVAEAGAKGAVAKFLSKAKEYHTGAGKQVAEGAKKIYHSAKGKLDVLPLSHAVRKRMAGEGAAEAGKGAAKFLPHAAAAGAAGVGAKKAFGKKKEG